MILEQRTVTAEEQNDELKSEGDRLIRATLNGTGSLMMQVEHVGGDTLLEKIVRMVGEARARAPRSSAWPLWLRAGSCPPWCYPSSRPSSSGSGGAEAVARTLGIDMLEAEVLPERKADVVKRLQTEP
jgi:cation transport ATPase